MLRTDRQPCAQSRGDNEYDPGSARRRREHSRPNGQFFVKNYRPHASYGAGGGGRAGVGRSTSAGASRSIYSRVNFLPHATLANIRLFQVARARPLRPFSTFWLDRSRRSSLRSPQICSYLNVQRDNIISKDDMVCDWQSVINERSKPVQLLCATPRSNTASGPAPADRATYVDVVRGGPQPERRRRDGDALTSIRRDLDSNLKRRALGTTSATYCVCYKSRA
ncbi:hypothetical protein EVAR_24767_1 [Eumeta japonica]|uniref:Uncharacterized protein n=1 Tax=Eumeta variegata TaxID=151549 RepID=A0A4C1VFM0_EUMVA|nr:hypothetical protein EVAR_24767_1 [Eumeta japonica]